MSEMQERVRRAICTASRGVPCDAVACGHECDDHRAVARAAIEAMRENTGPVAPFMVPSPLDRAIDAALQPTEAGE